MCPGRRTGAGTGGVRQILGVCRRRQAGCKNPVAFAGRSKYNVINRHERKRPEQQNQKKTKG